MASSPKSSGTPSPRSPKHASAAPPAGTPMGDGKVSLGGGSKKNTRGVPIDLLRCKCCGGPAHGMSQNLMVRLGATEEQQRKVLPRYGAFEQQNHSIRGGAPPLRQAQARQHQQLPQHQHQHQYQYQQQQQQQQPHQYSQRQPTVSPPPHFQPELVQHSYRSPSEPPFAPKSPPMPAALTRSPEYRPFTPETYAGPETEHASVPVRVVGAEEDHVHVHGVRQVPHGHMVYPHKDPYTPAVQVRTMRDSVGGGKMPNTVHKLNEYKMEGHGLVTTASVRALEDQPARVPHEHAVVPGVAGPMRKNFVRPTRLPQATAPTIAMRRGEPGVMEVFTVEGEVEPRVPEPRSPEHPPFEHPGALRVNPEYITSGVAPYHVHSPHAYTHSHTHDQFHVSRASPQRVPTVSPPLPAALRQLPVSSTQSQLPLNTTITSTEGFPHTVVI